MPDPSIIYKIVFDIGKASPKIDDVNPGLTVISRYYNTLAKGGVPADHRKFVVVFHQEGTDFALNNAAYKAVKDGHDNPNIALMHSMKQAGMDFRVCGQGVIGQKDRCGQHPAGSAGRSMGHDHHHHDCNCAATFACK